uniref:Tether containing UBX domain for GLUT4 n=1 Tax=Schistocephalus solidus TaxID=70667 RepID=A0A0X3QET5_SCHSO
MDSSVTKLKKNQHYLTPPPAHPLPHILRALQAMADQSPLESVPPPARVAAPMPPMKNDNGESFSLIFPSQAATQAPSNSSTSPFGEPFSIFGARPAKSVFGEPERQQPKQPKIATIGELLGVSLEPDTPAQTAFVPEELREFKFPEETAGQNLFYATDSGETEGAQQDCTPCDREAIIYRRVVPQSTDVEISDDVPDEFFELTEGELRRILARLREEAGTDAPLGASSLHQTTRARFYARYPRCILRFTWPDDVLLQACFRPGERVSALYDFIKDFLIPTAGDFQLYTTPPKVNIPNNSTTTLAEANLVPMTKIHLTLPSGPPRAVDVVRPEFLASMTPESATADEIAIKWISKQPRAATSSSSPQRRPQ